jgi:ubiquinone/menaquinone biosynthesis C-methylase UbiE
MINFLLKNPSLYRFYQKSVRAKYSEYDFFRFIFKQNNFKKIRMLDICCGDGHILEHVNEFISEYIGIDYNDKYLEQCRNRWKKFNFINLELKDNANIDRLIEFKPNFIFINGAIHHLDDKTVKLINSFIKNNFSECRFLSVDPVKYNNALLNKIMIMLDRGKFIRNKSEYVELMNSLESFIVDDFYQMKFENIFHYKNFDLKELYLNWKKEVS